MTLSSAVLRKDGKEQGRCCPPQTAEQPHPVHTPPVEPPPGMWASTLKSLVQPPEASSCDRVVPIRQKRVPRTGAQLPRKTGSNSHSGATPLKTLPTVGPQCRVGTVCQSRSAAAAVWIARNCPKTLRLEKLITRLLSPLSRACTTSIEMIILRIKIQQRNSKDFIKL